MSLSSDSLKNLKFLNSALFEADEVLINVAMLTDVVSFSLICSLQNEGIIHDSQQLTVFHMNVPDFSFSIIMQELTPGTVLAEPFLMKVSAFHRFVIMKCLRLQLFFSMGKGAALAKWARLAEQIIFAELITISVSINQGLNTSVFFFSW